MPKPTADELVAHQRFVHTLARSLLFDTHEAEDAAQDALVAALEEGGPSPRRSVRAWLRGVLKNRVRLTLRSRQRRRARELRRAIRGSASSAADDIARLEIQRRLVEAVTRLDDDGRTVVMMRFFDGLPPRRIAQRLGVPVETVKSRQKRALATLRGALDRVCGDRREARAALAGLAAVRGVAARTVSVAGGALLSGRAVAAVLVVSAALAVTVWVRGTDKAPAREAAARVERRGLANAPRLATDDPAAEAEPVRGVVVGPDGEPVTGAVVQPRIWDGRRFAPEGIAVQTDRGGSFETVPLNAGWWALQVRHPAHQVRDEWVDPRNREIVRIVLSRSVPLTVTVTGPDGDPVAGAAVVAHVETPDKHDLEDDEFELGDELGRRVTDREGRVRLEAVRGAISVFVDRAGFVPGYGEARANGADPIDIAVRLSRGGIAEGRVTGPEGKPIAGARVHVRGDRTNVVRTGKDGRYRLPALARYENYVRAEADGFGPGWFGETSGWGGPVPVAVRDGEVESGIDIVLAPPTIIVGRVVDERGRPLPGVDVSAFVEHADWDRATGVSGKDGRYRLNPVALYRSSTVRVGFSAAGYFFSSGDEVPIEPGKKTDVGTSTGRRCGSVSGTVIGIDGAPARTGRVESFHGNTAPIRPDGTFEIAGLLPGATRLVAFDGERNRSGKQEVEVSAGPVELKLIKCVRITGRVVDRDGSPRAGIPVLVVATEPEIAGSGYGNEVFGPLRSRRDGTFLVDHLLPGRYRVGVGNGEDGEAEFDATLEPRIVVAGGPEVVLTAPFTGGYVKGSVRAKRNGLPVSRFELVLLRMEGGTLAEDDYADFANATGEFRHPVAAGTWAVEAGAPGYALARAGPRQVRPGETIDFGELRLGAGGRVSGRVTDRFDHPVRWARVYLVDPDRICAEVPRTDALGRYEAVSVTPGRYTFVALSPRHPVVARRGIDVTEGAPVAADFAFPEAAPLTIRVADANARPVANAALTWTCAALGRTDSSSGEWYEPEAHGSNTADEHGVLRKPLLPVGKVTLVLRAAGYRASMRTIELTPGRAQSIEVRLGRE